jgi:hypothetical protein
MRRSIVFRASYPVGVALAVCGTWLVAVSSVAAEEPRADSVKTPAVAAAVASTGGRPSELRYEMASPIPMLDSSVYRRAPHELVLITDHDLQPRVVHLVEGHGVAWLSRARSPATIVFEREAAKHMVCRSLVNFALDEDELVSSALQTGDFASFCRLEAGRYRYKVVRRGAVLPEAAQAARRLDGVIIVAKPTESSPR